MTFYMRVPAAARPDAAPPCARVEVRLADGTVIRGASAREVAAVLRAWKG